MKNLKLVVAAMSMLGLISCPVLAAEQTKQKKMKATHVAQQDYKASGGLMGQPAPVMEVMPKVDTYQMTMDEMTQNTGRSKPMPDWFNRIGISGGMNIDAHWGNRSMGYMGENYQRWSLNDAHLDATAAVNDWTKAFASMSFSNFSPLGSSVVSRKGGSYSTVYANNTFDMEQGYVTFGNFDCSPVFVQLGKQFQDFGRYKIHPLTRSLSQVMSESLQTSAKLGFLTRMGLNGSVYTFDNTMAQRSNNDQNTAGHTTPIYGASLGFAQPSDQLGWDIGIGYMSNMTGVNDIASAISNYQNSAFDTGTGLIDTSGTYSHTVGGVNVYADVNSGPFSLGARYVTALQNFSVADLSTQYGYATNPANGALYSGAQPWAGDLTAGYGFNAWNKAQNVYVGYQVTQDAVNLLLPQSRWLVGYGIDVWKNASLGLEVARDNDYSVSKGGTGNNTNTIGARAAVTFG